MSETSSEVASDRNRKQRLAKTIVLHKDSTGQWIEIDGEVFPYFTSSSDGWEMNFRRNEMPSVTITIVAETVQVYETLAKPTSRTETTEEQDGTS